MMPIARFATAFTLFAAGALLAQANYVPTSPKPPQLVQAKSVFISNNTVAPLANSDRIYDEIYAGVQAMHRFDVTLKPDDADLILEFSLLTTVDDSQTVFLRVWTARRASCCGRSATRVRQRRSTVRMARKTNMT